MWRDYVVEPLKKKGKRFLITWLQVTILFVLVYLFTLVVYLLIYQRFTPTPIIRQPIYFDFSLDQPKAVLSLTALEKQWTNYRVKQLIGTGPRPLKSGALYDVGAFVSLSRCPRNVDLGKVALTTTIIDNSAEAVARSIRPVVVPYYTDSYLFLETIFTFPSRFFGFKSETESSEVYVSIFKDYQEPYFSFPAAEMIELMLSNNLIDIIDMELIILPHLDFISYWIFHYPKSTFFGGIALITLSQGSFYLFICFGILIFTVSTSEETEEEVKNRVGLDGLMDDATYEEIRREVQEVLQQSNVFGGTIDGSAARNPDVMPSTPLPFNPALAETDDILSDFNGHSQQQRHHSLVEEKKNTEVGEELEFFVPSENEAKETEEEEID